MQTQLNGTEPTEVAGVRGSVHDITATDHLQAPVLTAEPRHGIIPIAEIPAELSGLEEVRIVDHPEGLATPDPLQTEARATEVQAVVPQGTGVRVAELQVTEVPEVVLQVQGVQDLAEVPEAVQGVLALAGARAAVHEVLACAVPEVLHDLQEEGHQEAAEEAAEEDNNHPNYS